MTNPHDPQRFAPHNRLDPQTPRDPPIMTLTVLFFAAARDLIGSTVLIVKLAEGSTVAILRAEVEKLAPALAAFLKRCAIAVNQEFAADSLILRPDDEVAVIPPVSGGRR